MTSSAIQLSFGEQATKEAAANRAVPDVGHMLDTSVVCNSVECAKHTMDWQHHIIIRILTGVPANVRYLLALEHHIKSDKKSSEGSHLY